MLWEVWDAVSRNIIADFETEAEALAYVRVLIGQGWKAYEPKSVLMTNGLSTMGFSLPATIVSALVRTFPAIRT